MLLFDALKTIRARSTGDEEPIRFSLLCGLTPLHLRTFLTAELLQRMPAQGVDVQIGLFGDLIGNIERSIESPPNGAAVVIEWSDLDARLGFRSAFGWRPNCMADIVQSLTLRIGQLRNALVQLAESTPIAVSMPTLPLPPMFTAPGGSADITALQIRHQLQAFVWLIHSDSTRCLHRANASMPRPNCGPGFRTRTSMRRHWRLSLRNSCGRQPR